MIKRIVFLILVGHLCLAFVTCKKIPTSPVQAEEKYSRLQITIASEPAFLIFNWPAYNSTGEFQLKGETTVIISETNGVGCEIDSIGLKFVFQNVTYEPSSFEGGRLSSYGRLERSINLSVGYGAYEKIRIEISGKDDNGRSISFSKDFLIENLPGLDGVYKGEIAGIQFGFLPFTSILTLNIKQQGKEISGTWITELGTSGTFEGSFTAEGELSWKLEFNATQYSPSYGLYSSSGKINNWGLFLIGSFTGESGSFGTIDATFSVTRQ